MGRGNGGAAHEPAEYQRLARDVFGLPNLPIAEARRALAELAN
jgi:hypothetical protein